MNNQQNLQGARSLVTGITGFVGRHLAQLLLAEGSDVFGISRGANPGEILDQVAPLEGDLRDGEFIRGTLREADPTLVFHLASAATAESVNAHFQVTVLGTVTLLQALKDLHSDAAVVIVGSSAVYGEPRTSPVDEDQPLNPQTAYAASKASQEMVALYHFNEYGLRVIRARTFNLLGPGQQPSFVLSSAAKQIATAELEGTSTIRVGNLFPRRDFLDVRDAVRAYSVLAKMGEPGSVYNVCSGNSRSIQEGIGGLIAMSNAAIELVVDKSMVRPREITDQVGSYQRLQNSTSWYPMIPFEKSLEDLLGYWRNRLRR